MALDLLAPPGPCPPPELLACPLTGPCPPPRSVPDVPPCVTFDESLLEEGEALEPGELQLNELTVESVQHAWVAGTGRALSGCGGI